MFEVGEFTVPAIGVIAAWCGILDSRLTKLSKAMIDKEEFSLAMNEIKIMIDELAEEVRGLG